MSMLLTVARFELGQRLRRLSTWIYFTLFLALGYLFFIVAAGAFTSVTVGMATGGKVMVNSPHTLAGLVSTVSYFALLVTAALAGQAVHQDFQHRTYPLLFTTPMSRASYLGGRFLGMLAVLAIIQASTGIGCLIGSWMPFLDAKLVGPNRLSAYLGPYLTLVGPNLLILAPVFFAMGALTRKMRAVYVTGVLLLIGYLLAGTVSQKLESKTIAALMDPFGSYAMERLTEYWTPAEKNSRLVPLAGVLLVNRLIWLAVGLAALLLTFLRFRLAEPLEKEGRRRGGTERGAPATAAATATATETAAATAMPAGAAVAGVVAPPAWRLLAGQTWLTFRETVKSIHFLVIVLGGVLFVIVAARLSQMVYGTATYPVTRSMIELATGGFAIFGTIILVIFSGEMVWREREARIDQIIDALPVPGWLLYLSKLGALLMVGLLLQLVVMACGLGIQIATGYYRFQLPLYLFDLLGLRMVGFFQLAALALFVQVLVNHKHLGHFVMVLCFLANIVLPMTGFKHHLYRYGSDPGYVYSDMNGYGHFLGPWGWFNLYWSLAAVVLALLSNLLWARGQETRLGQRLRLAVARSRGGPRWLLAAALGAFVATGAYVFYNTNILHRYRTEAEGKQRLEDYERRYKRLEHVPQPKVTDVRVHFDIRPEERSVRMTGRFRLENRSGAPIPAVYVNVDEAMKVKRLALAGQGRPGQSASKLDDRLQFYTFALPQPLAPGATADLEFDLEQRPRGFKNSGARGLVMGNGTFIHSPYLPLLGYHPGAELSDDDDRRKRGLPPKLRAADLYDNAARQRNYVSRDAHWITFAASACTAADQLAVIPGYLTREWTHPADGRRCYAYRSEAKILHFFSVLSARYAVRRDRWRKGQQDVAIEVLYQPGHEYNLARMIDSVKASLDYFTTNFSPYPHRQLRIIEFPRYQGYAQAFPGTIPYSEGLGFIAKVDRDDPDDVDYPYYVTAHEVAHQWWAHQVIGGDVQGSTILSESLSQYSALMVMKATFGPGQMKRFLRHELDSYLQGRAMERKKELPLYRVENQPYIHYNKASLVFYALADAIGEPAVNRALAALLAKHAFRGPPYPTSLDLLQELRAVTPPGQQDLIADYFENITLYENRAISAQARPLPDQRFEITLRLAARKLKADQEGNETELPLRPDREQLEVGALDKDGNALHLERRPLEAGEQTVKFTVTGKPVRAGIDPLNKLIDRKPDDNLTSVELSQ
jgi:ABC-2 type transport system permease protein